MLSPTLRVVFSVPTHPQRQHTAHPATATATARHDQPAQLHCSPQLAEAQGGRERRGHRLHAVAVQLPDPVGPVRGREAGYSPFSPFRFRYFNTV